MKKAVKIYEDYKITFEDKNHNEVCFRKSDFSSRAEAEKYAKLLFSEMCDNAVTHYHIKKL